MSVGRHFLNVESVCFLTASLTKGLGFQVDTPLIFAVSSRTLVEVLLRFYCANNETAPGLREG